MVGDRPPLVGRPPRAGATPGIELAVRIGRPAAQVFALLADVQEAEPLPRSAVVRMEKLPSGPTQVGTRWHEAVRFAPGFWFHIENIVTEVEPPTLLDLAFDTRWFGGHLTYDIEPTEDDLDTG